MLPSAIESAVRSLPTVIKAGRRVNGLFRLLKSPTLWEQAYQKIATNKGAMTPGVDGQTFDGFSPAKVRSIIDRGSKAFEPLVLALLPLLFGRRLARTALGEVRLPSCLGPVEPLIAEPPAGSAGANGFGDLVGAELARQIRQVDL